MFYKNIWFLAGRSEKRILPNNAINLIGVSLTNGTIRVRGYTASGQNNGSAGMIQSTFAVPPPVADTDNDGVSDWWTQTYFGHPTGRADDHARADDDASGTHQNNLFKYVAGLDPTNPVSIFRLDIEAVSAQSKQWRLIFSPR